MVQQVRLVLVALLKRMLRYAKPTHINGAAHQRVSLVSLHHNLKQIRWHVLLHVKHLSYATSEVLHCLAR